MVVRGDSWLAMCCAVRFFDRMVEGFNAFLPGERRFWGGTITNDACKAEQQQICKDNGHMTRVYKFLATEWALDDIRRRRIRISEIHDLNDPFELIPFDLSDIEQRKQLLRARDEMARRGILCFSHSWSSPLLWAHYADRHRGICLGFDMEDQAVKTIEYVSDRLPFPTELSDGVAQQWIYTKSAAWKYEDEARAFVSRDQEEDGHYFARFDDNNMRLREVILGHRCCMERGAILALLGPYREEPAVIKSRPSDTSFEMVEDVNGFST